MESFYSTLKQVTKDNIAIRIEKEKSQQIAHQMKIKNAMENLFNKIKAIDIESKMKKCASEGYDKCELYTFDKGEIFEDFPLIFLTRGPQNYNGFGLKYFEEMNIIPYTKLLQQHFAPFNVYYRTNHKFGNTTIYVSWAN